MNDSRSSLQQRGANTKVMADLASVSSTLFAHLYSSEPAAMTKASPMASRSSACNRNGSIMHISLSDVRAVLRLQSLTETVHLLPDFRVVCVRSFHHNRSIIKNSHLHHASHVHDVDQSTGAIRAMGAATPSNGTHCCVEKTHRPMGSDGTCGKGA